jgi:MFS family permease
MMGAIDFGYTMGFSLPAVSDMKSYQHWTHSIEEWFTSSTSLAAIIGPVLTAILLNYIGRRTFFFANAVYGTIVWLLFLAVHDNNLWLSIVLRALSGVSIGAFSALVPLYLVELSPRESTGFFGTLNQLGIAIGFFLVYIIGTSKLAWHGLAGIGASITGLLSVLIWFVPESPALTEQLPDVDEQIRPSLISNTSLWELFVCSLLMLFQQTTGVNMILVYRLNLHTSADPNDIAILFSALASLAQVVACILGAFWIERKGRRIIWVISLLGVAITDGVYSLSRASSTGSVKPFPTPVVILLIGLFLLAYGLGAGPIPWFFVPERFPTPIRSYAMAIIACLNWFFAWGLINLRAKYDEALSGWEAFLVFAILSLIGALFGYFQVKNPDESARPHQQLHPVEEILPDSMLE